MTPPSTLTRIGASSRASERARVSAAALVMATPRVPTAIFAAPERVPGGEGNRAGEPADPADDQHGLVVQVLGHDCVLSRKGRM